jgi:hypothetical protein
MADRRALLLAAVLAALTALTAACGAIPSAGPVHAGATLEGPPPVRVLAAPPRAGSSPSDIVAGFLRAQPGLDEDEAVARAFLTGRLAQSWATHPTVVVYPDETTLHITAGPNDTFTVTAPSDATVDDSGVYTAAAPGAKATLRVKLTKVLGQWRISGLDNSQVLWLTSYDIDRVFAQVPLYYVAPGSRVLVPDIRWFGQTSGLATVIAQAQLAPPPPYLRSAVATGIPVGTGLVVDSVPTSGAVASIDLNSSAQEPSSTARSMLWAQLAASVTAAPSVSSVRVLVNGKLLELPGSSVAGGATASALGYVTTVPVSADPVALSAKGSRSVLTSLPALGAAEGATGSPEMPVPTVRLRSLGRSTDAREFAAVTADGHTLVRLVDGHTSVVLTGTDLTRPSYDSHRWLWTASSGGGTGTRLRAVLTGPGLAAKDVTGSTTTVEAPWLAGRDVTALRISRDGARALVTSVRRGVSRIDIAGVVRDSHARPISLTTPLAIGAGLNDVVDAAWVDATTVVVLATAAGDKEVEPYLIGIGAETTALAPVVGAVGIAAGDGQTSIAVITAHGRILAPGGSTGWVDVGAGTDIAYPG